MCGFMPMMQLIFSQANDKTSELGEYEQLLSKQGPRGRGWFDRQLTLTAIVPAKASRSSRSLPTRTEFQGFRYSSRSEGSDEKLYKTLVRFSAGVLLCSLVCAGLFTDMVRARSTKLDFACHNAAVTGEWYFPGHRVNGFSCGCTVTTNSLGKNSAMAPTPNFEATNPRQPE
jgi:hypothetical protein